MNRYISEALPAMQASLEAQNPAWLPEFNAFIEVLGPRPVVYERAMREWDAAVVGALLAWGFFISQLGGLEGPEGPMDAEETVAEVAEEGPAPVAQPASESDVATGSGVGDSSLLADEPAGHRESPMVVGVGGTFAILGPDGATVVEGVR